jgi:putative tryptophan/tyrosine transport system substrate-binding protein
MGHGTTRNRPRATIVALAVCGAVSALCSGAFAQSAAKTYNLGILSPAATPDPSIPTSATLVPTLLREAGYVEGQNLQVHRRYASGKIERLLVLAKELVDLQVDVILAVSPTAIKPALDATRTTPIVMGFGKDPVRDGLIASLAKPGGNITGVVVAPEDVLAGKRLELIKEAVPHAQTIALLGTSEPSSRLQVQEAQSVASTLGVRVLTVELRQSEYEEAFQYVTSHKATAMFVLASPILNAGRNRIVELAAKYRLPAIYEWPETADVGGMMAYGSSLVGLSRRVTWYVERILKGARPGDLPVEQPTKFELVINLKTAKQIGLTIPPNVLARADKVIK